MSKTLTTTSKAFIRILMDLPEHCQVWLGAAGTQCEALPLDRRDLVQIFINKDPMLIEYEYVNGDPLIFSIDRIKKK